MNSKEFLTRIQMKRDTSSNWVVHNPVLLDGEVVIVDTDAGDVRYKVGDGTKKFTQLPFTDESMLNLVNNKQDRLTIDALPTSGSSNPVASGGVKDYAVPQTRTVNGKPLSANVTLVASDVDADASGSAAQALTDAKSYTDTKVGAVESTVAALSGNVASTYETQTDAAEKLQEAKDYADSVASGKADTNHHHDDRYYTETDINAIVAALETKEDAAAKLTEANAYTDTQVSDLASTATVESKISSHNTATNTHTDIRALITDLNIKVSNFLDVDDETADQLSEVLDMIEANEGTIESLTSSKVSVSDIVNDLTTNVTTKVLSAAQGVQLAGLISGVENELNTHVANKSNPHAVTKAQVGLGNVDNTSDINKPVSTAQAAAIADAKNAGTQAQTNLTAHTNNKSNPHGVTAAQAGAVPLAGVADYTITGNLMFADSGTTSGSFRGLQGKCGGNDYWRVGGSQTGSNAGYMEISTADDGNEPIYVRQYSGTYSTLTRTATLLDGSGNTTFPGSVTVGNKVKMQYDSANECLNFAFG